MAYANQAGCYAASVILLIASTIAVGLRMTIRKIKEAKLGFDDLFISVALLLSYAQAIIIIWGTARGTVGTTTLQNPETGAIIVTHHEVEISHIAFLSQVISIVTYGLLKLSVLILFRRIFIGKIFNIVSIIAMTIVVGWSVSFFFATIFQCGTKPSWLWSSPKAVATYCADYKYIQLGHATSDVATDLLVLFIPLPIIWKLQMTMSQKLSLMCVFVLGYISTAAATARIVFIYDDLYKTTTGARNLRGEETNVMLWGYVEAGVGIIAACLPTLRPLLNSRMPESIVNSVRSKLSLASVRSRDNSKGSRGLHSSESHELQIFGDSSANRSTHIGHDTETHHDSNIPDDRILRSEEISVAVCIAGMCTVGIYSSDGMYWGEMQQRTIQTQKLLEEYSNIPREEQSKHVHEIRDQAWAIRSYPCTGLGVFLVPYISRSPAYPVILQKLGEGEKLLDIGCFLGGDFRRLVFDGAPSTNLYGIDIVSHWDVGFSLFNDRSHFGAHFIAASITTPPESQPSPLLQLLGSFSILSISAVLHQWNYVDQLACAIKLVAYTNGPAALIVGHQIGNVENKEVLNKALQIPQWRHNVQSWVEMWDEVGKETGTEWRSEAWLRTWEDMGWDAKDSAWMEPGDMVLDFVVTRIK
ncbi:hypothetical protein SBOR_0581 [Sclerotinia borealis F-4128]|uniref:Rhodopsin domain-containing protein n=1 Tax=Sclerotinia borealis (strain F-4128) TaxID=1432307 RepID=W9CQD9_SCLBF|nr:hypothetical protein SBOR_0581 [Sclerotinia borealis F-4128]